MIQTDIVTIRGERKSIITHQGGSLSYVNSQILALEERISALENT